MHSHPRTRTPVGLLGAGAAILTLVVASTVMTVAVLGGRHRVTRDPAQPAPSPIASSVTTPSAEPARPTEELGVRKSELDAEVARLRATPTADDRSPLPRITGDAVQQPDLYAAAFTTQLLTQD